MNRLLVAGPAHAAAMEMIHAACFPVGERWDAGALGSLAGQPGALALVDPDGGFVLARVAAQEAEILTLAVLPELRRQGRARALLHAAMRQTAAAGAREIFLEVGERNAAALGLYRAEGFHPVGRRPDYYADRGAALVLRRALDAADTTVGSHAP